MGVFEIRRGSSDTLEVVLRAPNGEVLLVSEGLKHRSEALEIVARIRGHARVDSYYERLPIKGGHIFTLVSDRRALLGISPKCATQVDLEGLIASVKVNAPDSPVEDKAPRDCQEPGRGGAS
jgi:uncharacterized protein YegP (UPF0339 family)